MTKQEMLSGEEMTGGGMIVYRAASMEEAMEITSHDPTHKMGGRTFTLRRWLVNEGSLHYQLGCPSRLSV